jgi:predicted nucleic acid-binding protein
MNAVDTNVLLYSLDDREPVKKTKARQLLQQLNGALTPTCMLWQVLAELVNQLRRWKDQGLLTKLEFDQEINVFRTKYPLILPRSPVLDYALDLANRYSLSHWDSMILGACKDAGVTTLYTEDMGSPRVIDGIQLINPLT